MTYNILDFPDAIGTQRVPSFRTVIDEVQPDILVVQEMHTSSGVNEFLDDVLNFTTPNLYSNAPFIDASFDTENALFYKSSSVNFISQDTILTNIRAISEYTLESNTFVPQEFKIYSVHLKSSEGSANEQQRLVEATILRNRTNQLPIGTEFMVVGDFNLYSDQEPAFQKLIGSEANNNGRFRDPINQSGNWHNNSSYSQIHTQSTRTSSVGSGGALGGLDDRFDFILPSYGMNDNFGIDFLPSTHIAFGNDGNHYNQSINSGSNSAVSSVVANALNFASDHLPVVMDFAVYSLADSTNPQINSASALNSNTVRVQFDENISQQTAESVLNYSVNNGLGNPTTAVQFSGNQVDLTFAQNIVSGITYILTVNNIQDTDGNLIDPNSTTTFFLSLTPLAGDLVISEFFKNPSAVSDSDGEFVEIYNPTANTYDLNGLTLRDNGTESHTINSPNPLLIQPNDFFVFGINGDSNTNGGFQVDYVYETFFLSNSTNGDEIVLTDGATIIDEVIFSNALGFPNPTGSSLELSSLNSDNSIGSNWQVSTIPLGNGDFASPGFFFETTPPTIDTVQVLTANLISVEFSEAVNLATSQNPSNYSIDNSIGNPVTANFASGSTHVIELTLPQNLTSATFTLTVNNVQDLSGNVILPNSTAIFSYTAPDPIEIIITEFMRNPSAVSDLAGEFVELYNPTNSPINIDGFILKDNDIETHTIDNGGSLLIPPNDFLVLGINGDTNTNGGINVDYVYQNFFLSNSSNGDEVVIEANGIVLDEVIFSDALGFPNPSGKSLEISSLTADNSIASNWIESTNQLPSGDFATPGFFTTAVPTPPTIDTILALNTNLISVEFSESVDSTTALDQNNYFINNSIGNPSSVSFAIGSSEIVELTLSQPLTNGNFTLTVNNVEDLDGNVILPNSTANFSYTTSVVVNLVITEIMKNPTAVSDSDGEFVEIFNPTTNPINIDGFVLRDNGSESHTIDNGGSLIIQPNSFLVLGINGDSNVNGGIIVDYVYSTFFLSNSANGDEVILEDNGIVIDEVIFSSSLGFPNPTGKSIEVTSLTVDNSLGSNWTEATNQLPNGDFATPGFFGSSAQIDAPSVSIQISGTDLILSWSAVTNATNYDVYELDLLSQVESLLGNSTSLNFTINNFSLNSQKYYFVKSKN